MRNFMLLDQGARHALAVLFRFADDAEQAASECGSDEMKAKASALVVQCDALTDSMLDFAKGNS